MLGSFSHLFKVWCYDLLQYGPKLQWGSTWYSISPQFGEPQKTPSGVPEGFKDDRQYLSGVLGKVIGVFFPVCPKVQKLKNPDDFFFVLACYLLSAEKLEIISIWNASFLTKVLETITQNREQIVEALAKKKMSVDGLSFRFTCGPRRLAFLKETQEFSKIWPHLKVISCWKDSHAIHEAAKIELLFPGVLIQGKGLLSTEAPVSIPLVNDQGAVPLCDEVFFEFIDLKTGKIHFLWNIEKGHCYEVVITQKAGLLRYKSSDIVKVMGFSDNLPLLKFQGRSGQLVDLKGEKLHLDRIRNALKALGYEDHFLALPILNETTHSASYRILLEPHKKEITSENLDSELRKNHHYGLARNLKQLEKAEVSILEEIDRHTQEFYQVAKGMKLGDIKPTQIIKCPKEARDFLYYLEYHQ